MNERERFDSWVRSTQGQVCIGLEFDDIAFAAWQASRADLLAKGGSEFLVFCGDDVVATTDGPREEALAEAQRYAAQYAEDDQTFIREVIRIELEGDPK